MEEPKKSSKKSAKTSAKQSAVKDRRDIEAENAARIQQLFDMQAEGKSIPLFFEILTLS